jgi:hypothetical protein
MYALVAVLIAALHLLPVSGIGQDTCVSFKPSSSSFSVVKQGKAAPVLLSEDDWPGVHRAAVDFALDIERVTNVKPKLVNGSLADTAENISPGSLPIIVGTLGKSSLIDRVVNATSLDVSSIQGRWESFMSAVVSNPLPGVQRAYVVIGSDKRGTIYALYDHSEQFGMQ